jgi:hypothetical protein
MPTGSEEGCKAANQDYQPVPGPLAATLETSRIKRLALQRL